MERLNNMGKASSRDWICFSPTHTEFATILLYLCIFGYCVDLSVCWHHTSYYSFQPPSPDLLILNCPLSELESSRNMSLRSICLAIIFFFQFKNSVWPWFPHYDSNASDPLGHVAQLFLFSVIGWICHFPTRVSYLICSKAFQIFLPCYMLSFTFLLVFW